MSEQLLEYSGIFDSHAHYFDSRFEGQADDLLRNGIFPKGVAGVINVATNPENARICIEQAAGYPRMWCAVGIHAWKSRGISKRLLSPPRVLEYTIPE